MLAMPLEASGEPSYKTTTLCRLHYTLDEGEEWSSSKLPHILLNKVE
jgi:hypothetical protein